MFVTAKASGSEEKNSSGQRSTLICLAFEQRSAVNVTRSLGFWGPIPNTALFSRLFRQAEQNAFIQQDMFAKLIFLGL